MDCRSCITMKQLNERTAFYCGKVYIQQKDYLGIVLDEVEVIYLSPQALVDTANYMSHVN